MPESDGTLSKEEFLKILGAQLRSKDYSPREKMENFKLYARVAGWEERKKEPPPPKKSHKKKPVTEKDVNEMILKIEQESRNGQLNTVGQGRSGQENQGDPSHARVQGT